ncbi:F0F1 ATP synthase subunit B' [Enterovirga aerilata]|uniref:ATP synthase subunit b n=1 Tax=Enterovirga aerilata TaxID=2730920 RepID=A0A849IGF5_9HYPH|nr:F0F1 ATP synthase subunit B' [Enterovirga sp. DB1703]NNM73003.1 F0F1 ATP synthase subunit B' [Enterovirga sp. DB1703]
MAQTGTTAGTVHEAAHGSGEFPPFNTATYPGQLVWLALTFGFLYFMMARIIVPRLSGIIGDRRRRIATDLEQAAEMRSRAEEAGRAYEQALAEARAKAQAIAQETRTALATESEVRRKALEADLAQKLAQAEAVIQARTESAMANVREVATEAASAIVERLTGRAPDSAAIESAYDRVARS